MNQTILFGGITHCTAAWSQDHRPALNECFKLYLPLDGEAEIVLPDRTVQLRPDTVYLINGVKIRQQRCPAFMDIGWLHFVPASLQLKYILSQYFSVKQWPCSQLPFAQPLLHILGKSFNDGTDLRDTKPYDSQARRNTRLQIDDATFCQLQGILIYLIGDLIESNHLQTRTEELAAFQRLQPAIEYMDQHINDNPPLKAIAARVCMAPNSFHRLFRNNFGLTPYQYMLEKRLTRARQLLCSSPCTIREIAARCGYENEFYFSRVFKKQYGLSPSQLRRQQQII